MKQLVKDIKSKIPIQISYNNDLNGAYYPVTHNERIVIVRNKNRRDKKFSLTESWVLLHEYGHAVYYRANPNLSPMIPQTVESNPTINNKLMALNQEYQAWKIAYQLAKQYKLTIMRMVFPLMFVRFWGSYFLFYLFL